MNYIIKIIKTDYDTVEENLYEAEIDDEDEEHILTSEDDIIAELLEEAVKKYSN